MRDGQRLVAHRQAPPREERARPRGGERDDAGVRDHVAGERDAHHGASEARAPVLKRRPNRHGLGVRGDGERQLEGAHGVREGRAAEGLRRHLGADGGLAALELDEADDGGLRVRRGHSDSLPGRDALVSSDDERDPGPLRGDQAALVDRGDGGVAAAVRCSLLGIGQIDGGGAEQSHFSENLRLRLLADGERVVNDAAGQQQIEPTWRLRGGFAECEFVDGESPALLDPEEVAHSEESTTVGRGAGGQDAEGVIANKVCGLDVNRRDVGDTEAATGLNLHGLLADLHGPVLIEFGRQTAALGHEVEGSRFALAHQTCDVARLRARPRRSAAESRGWHVDVGRRHGEAEIGQPGRRDAEAGDSDRVHIGQVDFQTVESDHDRRSGDVHVERGETARQVAHDVGRDAYANRRRGLLAACAALRDRYLEGTRETQSVDTRLAGGAVPVRKSVAEAPIHLGLQVVR